MPHATGVKIRAPWQPRRARPRTTGGRGSRPAAAPRKAGVVSAVLGRIERTAGRLTRPGARPRPHSSRSGTACRTRVRARW